MIMNKQHIILSLSLCAAFLNCAFALSEPILPLEGSWRFALDRKDVGIDQKWFTEDLKTPDTIWLPGSLQEQGFGDRPSAQTNWTTGIGKALLEDVRFQDYIQADHFKSPFWLTPQRHYVGPAWYQRTLTLPEAWDHQRIVLYLERPHWQTTVWVNQTLVGTQDSLGTPHTYDLTGLVSAGQNRLTIRVDNRVHIPVGYDAHSLSDQTQTNWNGIIGRICLIRHNPALWFDDVQVYPQVAEQSTRLAITFKTTSHETVEGRLYLAAESFNGDTAHDVPERFFPIAVSREHNRFEFDYPMGPHVQLWDEFSPTLYRLKLRFEPNEQDAQAVEHTVVFGMRQLGTSGTQFTLNGRPIYLRGTLECAIFPKTGYPPMDGVAWKRILRVCRAHGLNHLRFHSWCPPAAAFQAADEMGFYLQVEASCWAAFGEGSAVDTWIYDECRRMLTTYGNHPSFILMTPSNEPHGRNRDTFLAALIASLAKQDERRRFTAGAGWPQIEQNQFHVALEPRMQRYAPLRLSDPPQTAADYRDFVARYDVPVISHEIGQWCAYPNPAERFKYNGFLRGGNIEIARDRLDKAALLHLGHDFLMASGRFQALLYKAEIEAALRTPGFGGFQLLDLHDFPGQGTAPVGVLDCFWESKGYLAAASFRRFCSPTVPLARMQRLVFTNDQCFEATVDLAHYGPRPIQAQAVWYVRDQAGRVLLSDTLPNRTVATGGLSTLGKVRFPLKAFDQAQKLNFEVALCHTDIANDWDIWVYPAQPEPSTAESTVYTTEAFDDRALSVLKDGGKVLLIPPPARLKSQTLGTFRPIFWNRITFAAQPEHTLGILCDPQHPVFALFPTDFYSNWQWWDLLERSKPIVLDDLKLADEPLIRAIDDWNLCRSLGLMVEAEVEKGKLLVCSIDIHNDLDSRPAARQLRRSVLDYMGSPAFLPKTRLTPEAMNGLFREPTTLEKLRAKVFFVSSEQEEYEGPKAIDNNPATLWHTQWAPQIAPRPHEIQLDLNASVQIRGFCYLPRQDGNRNGWIADYEFYASEDAADWGPPAAKGRFENNAQLKVVRFERPVKGRFVRLVSLSGFGSDPHTSAAEIDVLVD